MDWSDMVDITGPVNQQTTPYHDGQHRKVNPVKPADRQRMFLFDSFQIRLLLHTRLNGMNFFAIEPAASVSTMQPSEPAGSSICLVLFYEHKIVPMSEPAELFGGGIGCRNRQSKISGLLNGTSGEHKYEARTGPYKHY